VSRKAALTGSNSVSRNFGSEYLNEEWVKLELPYNADITLRDRVTNIRTPWPVIWSEEESDGNPPTTFDVFRVSPRLMDWNLIGKIALVKRAVVQ